MSGTRAERPAGQSGGSDPRRLGKELQLLLGRPTADQPQRRRGGRSLLMNEARRRIFTLLWNRPMIHLRAVAAETSMAPPTAQWHLQRLLEAGLTQRHRSTGKSHFLVPAAVFMEDLELLRTCSDPAAYTLLRTVAANPGTHQAALVQRLAGTSVPYHLRRLTAIGLVDQVIDGRLRRAYLGALVQERHAAYVATRSQTRQRLLALLEADGVQPRVVRNSRTTLEVRLVVGGTRPLLAVNLSPFQGLVGLGR